MPTQTRKKLLKAWLADVPADKVFWCCDGRVMRNLNELAVALSQISLEAYGYHANSQKNDFSKWIQDVIGDETLAKDLRKAGTSAAAAQKVESRVAQLRGRV